MPTPSDNTPHLSTTTIGDDLSAHTTCPPDVDRWSTWRSLPEGLLRGAPDGFDSNAASPSPAANATMTTTTATTTMAHAHSVLMPSPPSADADPMRVDSEGPTATVTKQKHGQEPDGSHAGSQEEGRLSPAGEPSRLAGQQPSSSSSSSSSVATTSSSTAALLSYEFSNVRVRCTMHARSFFSPDTYDLLPVPGVC